MVSILKRRSPKTDDGVVTVRVTKSKRLFVAEVETKAGKKYSATNESSRQAEHEAFRLYVEAKYEHLVVAERQQILRDWAEHHKVKIPPGKK